MMLIDIQQMPNVFGVPINRRLTIYSGLHLDDNLQNPHVYWPTVPLYHNKLHVGALITQTPANLYKAVYLTHDQQWVFETVFAMNADFSHRKSCQCLYTKMINRTSCELAIAKRTIEFYQGEVKELIPLSNLIAPVRHYPGQSHRNVLTFVGNASDSIVPFITDEKHLWEYIDTISNLTSEGLSPDTIGMIYKPLYTYEPQLFEALVMGNFTKSPFYELSGYHPSITISKDKWFLHDEIGYSHQARGLEVVVNHPAFDYLALALVKMFPGKISLQCAMMHAVDSLKDIWLTKMYHNPYYYVFNDYSATTSITDEEFFYRNHLETIFYQCAMIYCRLYNIDWKMFLERSGFGLIEESSITITKNFYDEIVFIFHDLKNDRYVSFYSSLPALALSTMAVGWY